jgi:hypothetical protein
MAETGSLGHGPYDGFWNGTGLGSGVESGSGVAGGEAEPGGDVLPTEPFVPERDDVFLFRTQNASRYLERITPPNTPAATQGSFDHTLGFFLRTVMMLSRIATRVSQVWITASHACLSAAM